MRRLAAISAALSPNPKIPFLADKARSAMAGGCAGEGGVHKPLELAVSATRTGGSPEMLISPATCRLDRCSRTSILGVSIRGLHRVPSAGSAIGVGVTLSGVEGLKIWGGPNGAPAPETRRPSRGVVPQGVGWPPRCSVAHPDIATSTSHGPAQAGASAPLRPTSARMNPVSDAASYVTGQSISVDGGFVMR